MNHQRSVPESIGLQAKDQKNSLLQWEWAGPNLEDHPVY